MTATQIEGVQLQEWANDNVPDEKLYWKDEFWTQIVFVRDRIARLFAKDYDDLCAIRENRLKVISVHRSKSVLLPVYRLELENGMAFTMRNNFYDWKVSVESPDDVSINFEDLFRQNNTIPSMYCEGFPENLVFGAFPENRRQFTVELSGDFQLYTFLWLISRYHSV